MRFGEFSSLTGQNADAVGSVLFTYQDWAAGGFGGVSLSPNGSQFVISLPSGNARDLFLYTTSSPPTLVRQVTTSGESAGVDNVHPEISPNGAAVAFAATSPGQEADLYIVGLDGTGLTQLTSDVKNESSPSWSPDGERIAFQRLDEDNWNIYVLKLTGGGFGGAECDTNTPCEEDGVFCNGAEVCVDGQCESPGDPCAGGDVCDEEANACVPDDDSDEGETGTVTGSVVDAQTGGPLAGSSSRFPVRACQRRQMPPGVSRSSTCRRA
ncbi:MAG: TolB family protein [Planctomycetota bacterium]